MESDRLGGGGDGRCSSSSSNNNNNNFGDEAVHGVQFDSISAIRLHYDF
jgi:hypothetical protein